MRFCREENQDYALITYCCLCCNQRWASNCCKAHRTFGASVLLLRSLQKFLHLVKKWKTLKKNLILFELQKCTHFSILSKDIHLAHTWNSVLWMLKVNMTYNTASVNSLKSQESSFMKQTNSVWQQSTALDLSKYPQHWTQAPLMADIPRYLF